MRASRNYWLDILMAALASILAVSSFLLWVVLPQGYFRSRVIWLNIHKWSGLAITIAVLLHIAFHWRWLWSMTARLFHGQPRGARPGEPDFTDTPTLGPPGSSPARGARTGEPGFTDTAPPLS